MGNWRLLVGLVCAGILLFIALFGPELAPYPENYNKMIEFVQTAHGKVPMSPPFPPSPAHWFGTNRIGRDILSLLLYGAKYTIFTAIVVAVVRVLIGGGTGLWSGILTKERKTAKGAFGILGSLPSFLIVYFVMIGITINSALATWEHAGIEGILLTVVGIPGIHSTVRAKTVEERKKLFIKAAVSLGASKIHIVRKHIFPYMRGNLLIMFVNEIISVLCLIGQLGIFHIFLGGTIYRPLATLMPFRSKTHEWAGMVGQFRSYLFNMQWVVVFPLCAIMFAILTFYLLAQGLEQGRKNAFQKYPYL